MKAVHVLITGHVQGVWYRDSTRQQALALGVEGFVRNLRDGRVEGWFQGPDEAVDALVAWCRTGPELARVTDVALEDRNPREIDGFYVAADAKEPGAWAH